MGDFRSKFALDLHQKWQKSSYFQGFHFRSSVLQTHNRNKYNFYLSDQLRNNFICKNLIFGDFESKSGPDLGQKMGENGYSSNSHFSSFVLMSQNRY